MLKIYTDSSMSSKEYLLDVEAEFDIDEPIIDSMYMDDLSTSILKKMEGMISRNGKYIEAKFGTVSIMDISTGCKALLLCSTRNNDWEMVGSDMSTLQKDIEVVTHRVLKYFPDNFQCYINNEKCDKDDIPYALAEILGEETF